MTHLCCRDHAIPTHTGWNGMVMAVYSKWIVSSLDYREPLLLSQLVHINQHVLEPSFLYPFLPLLAVYSELFLT